MGACGELWIERVVFVRLDVYSIQSGKRLLWDGWNVRRLRDSEMYHGGRTERPVGMGVPRCGQVSVVLRTF